MHLILWQLILFIVQRKVVQRTPSTSHINVFYTKKLISDQMVHKLKFFIFYSAFHVRIITIERLFYEQWQYEARRVDQLSKEFFTFSDLKPD